MKTASRDIQRVLVVDDAAEVQVLVRGVLEAEGYEVESSTTGRQALERITSSKVDLIILDVDLPDMQGTQICSTLRQQGCHLPIVMLTARNQVMDRTRGLELGADDYLGKPFAPEELVARVRAQLRREAQTAARVEGLLNQRWQQIHRGLSLAQKIQQPLLRQQIPDLEMAVQHLPVGRIGGDLFLVEEVQDSIYIMVGDTMGKGIGASLVMSWSLSILHALIMEGLPPAELLTRANQTLAVDLESLGVFVTVFVARYHRPTRELSYSSAGAEPPILIKAQAQGRRHLRLATEGLPLGVFADSDYQQSALTPAAGDRLFLFTDGLTESVEPEQQPGLLRGLYRMLLSTMDYPVHTSQDALMQQLRFLTRNHLFLKDDLTFLLLEFPR